MKYLKIKLTGYGEHDEDTGKLYIDTKFGRFLTDNKEDYDAVVADGFIECEIPDEEYDEAYKFENE